MKKILSIKELKKYYHTLKEEILALDNISFDVYKNEFISIVGPSGCGKSTILSILSELIDKSSGSIELDNKCRIAYMLQDDCLLPFRTVLDNCLIGLEIKGEVNNEDKKYVLSLLKKYGLFEYTYKYPNSLSGGMRQKVALIRTLAVNPDILLLDEATSALDYQTTLEISKDIKQIIKSEGKTAIMVTHDIPLAISMSDRVIVLSNRPATIKKIYNIQLRENDPIKRRKEKDFLFYYEKVWEDLRNES